MKLEDLKIKDTLCWDNKGKPITLKERALIYGLAYDLGELINKHNKLINYLEKRDES